VLEGLRFVAIAGLGNEELRSFLFELVVLLLDDGAFEELVDSLAGGPAAFCGFDVVIHVRVDGGRLDLGEQI